jgi:hypothetical protein
LAISEDGDGACVDNLFLARRRPDSIDGLNRVEETASDRPINGGMGGALCVCDAIFEVMDDHSRHI